jgi:prevent-host-death family protein
VIEITTSEFKANLGKYLAIAGQEDIHITKNGANIAVLTAPKPKRDWVDDIAGIIQDSGLGEKQFKAERLAHKYESLN